MLVKTNSPQQTLHAKKFKLQSYAISQIPCPPIMLRHLRMSPQGKVKQHNGKN